VTHATLAETTLAGSTAFGVLGRDLARTPLAARPPIRAAAIRLPRAVGAAGGRLAIRRGQ
jgi:hypothetical protein